MIEKLRHKYALSEKGACDMIQAIAACVIADLALMVPVALLYFLTADLLTGGVSEDKILAYAAGSVACLLLILVTTFWKYNASFFATYIESGIRRITLAEKLRKLPLSFFGKKDLADLTSTIMSDCATLETAQSHWIPELIGSLISTTLIAIGLFFFDWRMAIAALWVLPVAFLIVIFSSRVQHSLGRKLMHVKMACADGIQECLESARDLRANNAEAEYLKGLDAKIRSVEKRSIISELGTAVFVVSGQMILKIGIATTALTGGILLVSGTLDILTFFMFLLVVSRIYDPLQTALQNLMAVISADVRCERMSEILEHPVQTGAETLSNIGYDVKFDRVNFAYGDGEDVLQDVSFTAHQGEVTALIGPSGSGKTTIAGLAARFWDISSGKITVGGMDIAKTDPETLLSLYSIVFQNVTLFNNTIMENIRLGRKGATDEEVLQAARLANCDEFAEKLPKKWHTLIGENGSRLSGGERQRISIARAFLKNAPIILLDEATASLDVDNETLIQESLSRLIQGKTVIIIAHRMRTVSNADKIVVLKEGNVVQDGTPGELAAADGMYRHIMQLQNDNGAGC